MSSSIPADFSNYELPRSLGTQHWVNEALCLQIGTDLFYLDPSEPATEAKKACALCPVRQECLQWALETDERFGIWGGTTFNERVALKRQKRD